MFRSGFPNVTGSAPRISYLLVGIYLSTEVSSCTREAEDLSSLQSAKS
jgi:hypothetical protein